MFLRRLASGLAPRSTGLRLLTRVRMQTLCQRSRAAGVQLFYHVGQPMPDAVVSACEAPGTRRVRGSRAPPYDRRRSASHATRCDDVVSPGQHVVSAPQATHRRLCPGVAAALARGLPRPSPCRSSPRLRRRRGVERHVSHTHQAKLPEQIITYAASVPSPSGRG
jgi:hypothetical protein